MHDVDFRIFTASKNESHKVSWQPLKVILAACFKTAAKFVKTAETANIH